MATTRWLRLAVVSAFLAAGLSRGAEQPFSFATTPGQLPKSVFPQHYALRIEPDLAAATTHGVVVIDLEVIRSVKEIVLNALEMDVKRATLASRKQTNQLTTLTPELNAEKQTLTLALPAEIAPGEYQLTLEFNGRLGERAQGLFRVKYSAPSGRKVMLASQMEPADARRMFPCWDEPVFRASYDLTVVVPLNHLPVSNMPIERQTLLTNGLKEVKFQQTPPMASYLVVLVSGELEELKGEADGVPIRIITTEGKREQGRYALEVTKQVLKYYNDYFGVRYPLPKLDQIAVPGGFSGAMENWGGITYNERTLLFDPQTSSQATRQGIFGVVAHEMAHQWFGDLVTTAWWDNLWLNEGFASWMSAKTTDHFNPEWQVSLSAGAVKNGVMNADARSATHPILRPIRNESEANDAFDAITYQKGQSFLRMLENFLGEDAFRKGIRQYMLDHRYSNTTTADLWEALEKASGQPVSALSAGWTEQPGFPIVQVKTKPADERNAVTLEQERFTVMDPDAKPLQWQIPVALMNVTKPGRVAFALLKDKTLTVPFGAAGEVIKANAGDAGYYRVQYEPALFNRILARLNDLPAADRLNLLDDGWALVEAKRATAVDYLQIAESLNDERTFAIWNQVIGTLELIDGLEQGRPERAAFRDFARQLLRPQLKRLGWSARPGEASTDVLLRGRVITLLGNFGEPQVIAEAQARFAKFLVKPATLPADLRQPVMTLVGRYSDRKTYDQLHDLARTATGTEERQLYYRAMAGALDPELARATLAISLTQETVPQETTRLVTEVAQAGEQPELAWDFAQKHLKELLDKLEAFRLNGYVPSIMGAFSDAARADELETFVKANIGPDALAKAKETAEGIRLKAALKERELPGINAWIAAQSAARDKVKSPGD